MAETFGLALGVAAGVPVLRLAATSMPALAACHILSAALRGGGETRLPLVTTLAGFFLVRLPLTAWLTWDAVPLPWAGAAGTATALPGLGLGLWGCWLAMQADLWMRGAAHAAAFARRWSNSRGKGAGRPVPGCTLPETPARIPVAVSGCTRPSVPRGQAASEGDRAHY